MKKIIINGAIALSIITAPVTAQAQVTPEQQQIPEHRIELTGTACSSGEQTQVSYTASTWAATGDGGLNSDIAISYRWQKGNAVGYDEVGHGAFADPTRFFTGTFVIDSVVDQVDIIAEAVANWGNGYHGGQMATHSVIVQPCPWDKSSLVVTGSCVKGDAVFVAENHGSTMTGTTTWELYQDNVFVVSGSAQWGEGEIKPFTFSGYTGILRFVAYQRPGHPGNSVPQATVNTAECTATHRQLADDLCGSPNGGND